MKNFIGFLRQVPNPRPLAYRWEKQGIPHLVCLEDHHTYVYVFKISTWVCHHVLGYHYVANNLKSGTINNEIHIHAATMMDQIFDSMSSGRNGTTYGVGYLRLHLFSYKCLSHLHGISIWSHLLGTMNFCDLSCLCGLVSVSSSVLSMKHLN